MKTVMQEHDSRPEELPLRVQEAPGELVGAAKEGLLALNATVKDRDPPMHVQSSSTEPRQGPGRHENTRLQAASSQPGLNG